MSIQSIYAGAAFVKLTLDNAELKRGLNEAQGKIQNFADSVKSFSSQMALFGPLLATPFVMATRAFAAFDDQMRLTGAVTGATGKQFEALTETAKKLGRETSFTAAQVAGGMAALGRMGFNPDQIQNAIKPIMNLARATGTELSVAAEIAANTMRALGIETAKTGDVVDILTTTANGSAQTLTDLGEALKMAAPAARTAGENVTDVNAALGVLANVGIRGSMAGTALKRAYSELAKTDVQDFLRQYNIQTVDATGNLRKMADVLRDCAAAMTNMGSAEKIAFATQVFGERAAPAALSLTADTSKIDEMLEKLKNCKGAAQATADQMDQGLGGALRKLSSAAEGVNIALGEIIATSFGPVIESASAFANVIRDVISANKELAGGIMGLVGGAFAIGTLIKSFAVAGSMIKSMYQPLAALDAMFSRSAEKAAAAAAAQQQRAAATEARVAREIAAEKLKTSNELAEEAKQKAAIADKAAAELQALKNKKTANDFEIAESKRIIANKQAETAAIIAEEQKIIAAQQGRKKGKALYTVKIAQAKIAAAQNEAAATITAETEKQAAIEKTNLALTQQITAQNGIAGSAAKAAAASSAAATRAAADYTGAAAAAKSAAQAEIALSAAQKTGTRNAIIRLAVQGKLSSAMLFGAALSAKHAKQVLAASVTEMVAARRAAAGSGLRVAGYYAEAIAAKVAAGATVALRTALNLLMAHPVTIALLAMAAALWAIQRAANATNESFRKQSEAAREAAKEAADALAAGDTKRQKAEVDFTRIKQLEEISARGKLSAEEMAEAEQIINRLNPYGSSQWASLDKVAGQLTLAADAQKKFNDEMKKAAELQIQAEIAKLQAEQKALQDENQQLLSYQNHNMLAQFTGRQAESVRKIEENGKRAAAVYMEIAAAQKRLKAIRAGDQDAVTGKDKNSTADRAAEAEEKRRASAKELADAEKELARIDEENARKKMTQLEQEIAQIEKMKAKYLELANLKKADLQADLRAAQKRMKDNAAGQTPAQKAAYEAAKKAAETAQSELDALDKRISQATADFAQQTADAKKKDAEKKTRSEQKYTGYLQDFDQKQQQRAADKAQDQDFQKLNQDKSAAGIQALNAFMNQLAASLEAAKNKYSQMLAQYKSAGSEGGADLSDKERTDLSAIQQEINSRAAKLESYRDRMQNSSAEIERRTERQQQYAGTFNAADVDVISQQNPFDEVNNNLVRIREIISRINRNTKDNNLVFG